MDLFAVYAITGFLCAVACLIVSVQAMRLGRNVISTEPLAIAFFAVILMGISWANWYPGQTETIGFVGLAVSLLAAWAAWKDSTAAARAMQKRG